MKNLQQNFFSSSFGFDSALKTIDAQMSFWSVFLKTHKKKAISDQKRHFGCFWQLITFFLVHCINTTDKNNICVSIISKAKAKTKFQNKIC